MTITKPKTRRQYLVAFLSGKGGVTKTTLARACTVAFENNGWKTGVFDLDLGQASFFNWNKRREHFGHQPEISVMSGNFSDIERLYREEPYQLLLVDGAAYGSQTTEKVAAMADMIVMSCRFSLDDMQSAVETMNGLVLKGVPAERFCVVFSGVPEQRSPANYVAAQNYMNQTPYFMVDGFIEQKNSLTDAQNEGLAINEVKYKSVREKIDAVIENIAYRFQELVKG